MTRLLGREVLAVETHDHPDQDDEHGPEYGPPFGFVLVKPGDVLLIGNLAAQHGTAEDGTA